MEQNKTTDLQSFINAISTSMKIDRTTGIEKYLLCGMADEYNYNGRLTKKIFFDNFYVKPNDLNRTCTYKSMRKKYNNAVRELLVSLDNKQENFLILSGPAGSGKSTFVMGFPQIIKSPSFNNHKKGRNINTIRLDCASSSATYNDVSMKFPMEQLICAYNEFSTKMTKDKAWEEKFDWLLNLLSMAEQHSNNNSYANRFVDFLISNQITCALTSKNWINSNNEKNISVADRQFAIALLILMLSCKISVENSNKKEDNYIIFFDNLEMYIYHTDQPIHGYVSIAKNLNSLFSELPNIIGVDIDPIFTGPGYMTHFSFVLCLRTSTQNEDIEYLSFDGIPNQWSDDKVRRINFPTYDFSPYAIQNKLIFLQTHEELKPYFNEVLSYVKPLYDIDINKPIDDDLVSFSSNYYFPFNNCNYRIVVITLEEVVKYTKELAKLEDILNNTKSASSRSSIINYIINGKRMITTRSRYEFLHDQGYLEQLGIANFTDEHRQSNVRAILNYIFFKGNCDKKDFERAGRVNFLSLKKDVRPLQYKSFADIADVVIALGPISCNRIREEALRKWGALIDISGIDHEKGIIEGLKDALTEDDQAAQIQISLTPAGKDYVLHESKQFEYFLFRITDDKGKRIYKPLFSYLQFEDVQNAQEAISQVYSAVESYIGDFDMDCPVSGTCELKNCEKCFSEDPMLCMTIIRAFDFFSIIRQHINYIDRYRCVLITNLLHKANRGQDHFEFSDLVEINKINCNLIDLLAKYMGLYDRMEVRLKAIEMNGDNLYNHILNIVGGIVDYIGSNDIIPIYHLPSKNNLSGYPFIQGSKSLDEVFARAKQNALSRSSEQIKRIYQIMDEVYENVSNNLWSSSN